MYDIERYRLLMSIETVKENIRILEEQEPDDAGYLLQLEHEKHILSLLQAEANGNIIIPPCKAGDEVYAVGSFTQQINTLKVAAIQTAPNDIFLLCDGGVSVSVKQQLNKSVFLTRKEAEKYRGRLKNEHTA